MSALELDDPFQGRVSLQKALPCPTGQGIKVLPAPLDQAGVRVTAQNQELYPKSPSLSPAVCHQCQNEGRSFF